MVFFALYLGLAGLVLPQVVRFALEKRLSQSLNSSCRVESLSFNPFTLALTASNIRVPYPGDAGMFLHLDRLEASPLLSSFFRLTPGIRELRLDSPVIDLTLFENGVFSPNLFFDGQKTDATDKEDIFPCVVQNFSVNNGTLTFRDQGRGATQRVENISLAVPFVSTLPKDAERAVTPQLSATLDGRPLSFAGETRPFSSTVRTEFTLHTEELDLERFRAYIAPYTRLEPAGGVLSTTLTLRILREEGKTAHVALAGVAEIRELELTGPQGTVVKVPHAKVDVEHSGFEMQRVVVNEAFLDSPAVTVRRGADGAVDWRHFFTAPGQGESAASPPAFVVTRAGIRDGAVTWHDASVPGLAPHTVRNIQGLVANFDSGDEGKADFSLEFGEGQAKFASAGTISLNPLRIEASMNMERMAITPFAGYLAQATDLSLHGAIGFHGDFAVEHGTKTILRLGGITLYNGSASFPGSPPLCMADTLTVRDIVADLSARNVTVGRIAGSGVKFHPVRGKDGTFDLGVPAGKSSPQSPGWHVTADNVRLDSSSVTLTDRSLGGTHVLPFSAVSFSASSLSTQAGRQWTADLSARPGRHGVLRLEARGAFSPLAVSFRLRADKTDLVFLSPYIRAGTGLSLAEGILNADIGGQIQSGRKSGEIGIEARGDAGLHGVSLTRDRREVFGWGRLRAENFHYRSSARDSGALGAEKLIFNGPRVSVTIGEDGASNIQRLLFRKDTRAARAKGSSPQPSSSRPSAAPVGGFSSVSLGSVTLTSGEFSLRDERLQPPQLLKAENIRMDMGALSSDPDARGELEGAFTLQGSPILLSAKMNPLIAPFAGEVILDIADLDLADFSRYAVKYTGYPIRRGELSARVELSLNGLDVSGRNNLVLGKLDVGDKDPSSGAPDLPIKAAVSLLRDLSGDISLSLPLAGRLDDPQFRIGGVMGRTVLNTMLKTAAAPVTLIGGFFSIFTSAKREERINFAHGADRISRRMSDSLRELVESLSRRGRARLELTGIADMREKTDMTLAVVERMMRRAQYDALPEAERAGATPDRMRLGMHVDAEEYARLLRELYQSRPEKAAGEAPLSAREMMRVMRSGISVSDEQVQELAQARANAVRNEIIGIDPSFERRISIEPPRVMSGSEEARRINSCVLIVVK